MKIPTTIYLDYNATTPVAPEVVNEMLPYFLSLYGNPSSNDHIFGWQAAGAVDDVRDEIAKELHFNSNELIFTAGATEAINLVLRNFSGPGNHIITVETEHNAVLDTCADLVVNGTRITYLSVNEHGLINLDELKKGLETGTSLVCIMMVNNETGVMQPMTAISALCKKYQVPFMSDATQAIGKIPVQADQIGIDILVGSAHKFYGPKGVGFLAANNTVLKNLKPIITGGGQEMRKRAGTINVPAIVGMGKALSVGREMMAEDSKRIEQLRNKFENALKQKLGVTVNGGGAPRLFNTSNVSFYGIDSQRLMQAIGSKVAASRGSACSSVKITPSHVLMAMQLTNEMAHSAVRFSFGRYTTEQEVDTAIKLIVDAIKKLRHL